MADDNPPPPNTSNQKKRKKGENNSPSDEEAEYTARYQKIVSEMQKAKIAFPRFLLMMSGDEDKSLSRLSTFAIQKEIEGLVGEPKNIKRLRSGDLLIEVDRETFSTKLLAIKHIAGIPVKVSPHRTLNTAKGVIRTQEIKNTTNEELKTQLKRQGVSDSKIITIRKNGDIIKLSTAVLTFNFPKPPADINVGFELCPVQLYIPHSLRCFKCQQFGHHQEGCKRERVCGRCGQSTEHPDSSCTYPIKCANCGGNHTAYSRDCPRWKTEKEIQRIQTERKISFPEARKIVEGVTGKPSYASVLAKQVVSVGCQTDLPEVTSAAGATNVTKTAAAPSAKPDTNNKATPNASKILANDAKQDAKQAKNNTTQPQNSKDKKKETTNKPSIAEKPTKEKEGTHTTVKPRTNNSGIGRLQKGMDDPISVHNRFESMDCSHEADSSDSEVFVCPDTVAALQAQIKPGRHKNS